MWCKHCQQDVPALPGQDEKKLSCPRCGTELKTLATRRKAASSKSEAEPTASAPVAEKPAWDSWEEQEALRYIGRVLKVDQIRTARAKKLLENGFRRVDSAHAVSEEQAIRPPHWDRKHALADRASKKTRKALPPERGFGFLGFLTWTVLACGITTFVCGGVLLGWSMIGQRDELWRLGVPFAVGGQVALLLGLILQLERVWHDGRSAAAKLDEVDEELHELKSTTNLLGASPTGPSSAFYSHFSGGAGPHILLTDLKSQLDLLAAQLRDTDEK